MTNKPIIIDGIDVSECYYYVSNGECTNENVYPDYCKVCSNCTYKLEQQLKGKEQECEEWKNKYYSSTTEVKADLIKQINQLEAENKEYKNIINKLAGKTIAITSGDKPFEFCDHKDLTIKQLKLDKETYKYQWEKQYELCEYWQGQAEKHKQTLQEIKGILEQYLDYDKRVDKEADVDVYLMAMQKWLNKVEHLK